MLPLEDWRKELEIKYHFYADLYSGYMYYILYPVRPSVNACLMIFWPRFNVGSALQY